MASDKVFLLSPAYCGGRRAKYLLREGSELPLAKKLVEGTLTLGEAFSFMSGLYFRGKLGYALHFGQVRQVGRADQATRVFVITPTRGLQSPDLVVTPELLREFAAVDVKTDDVRYRTPLDRDLKRLAKALPPGVQVVLLGSIATGKYVDALTAILGNRLHYPAAFVGRGDMSRGGLMLRSIAANAELEYTPLLPDVSRHGIRPPKLEPMTRAVRQVSR